MHYGVGSLHGVFRASGRFDQGAAPPASSVRGLAAALWAPAKLKGASYGLGGPGRVSSNGRMIQTTTRLSRSARLRRGRSLWIYGLMVLSGVALCGLALFLRHWP
jgi:hypothetical protein